MMLKLLRSKKGFSFVELLITIAIVATFGSIMVTVVMAAQKNTKATDMVAFFDNRNLNAVSIFKTDPSQDYLSKSDFFKAMNYDEGTRTYTEYFDKDFIHVEHDSDKVKYRSSYEVVIADGSNPGFSFENKEIKLSIKNMQKSSRSGAVGGYELINSEGATGNVSIHTNVMEAGDVVGPSNPDPSNPDPSIPDGYFYVSFELDGGYFYDTGNETLVKRVKAGSKFSDIIPMDETGGKEILPAEYTDFTKNDSSPGPFTGWLYNDGNKVNKADKIDGNITVKGSYNAAKSVMVTFALDGGTFIEYLGPTGNGTLSKYVKVGSRFGDIAPVEGTNFDKLDPNLGTFSGWFYNDGSKVNEGDVINGDVTVKGSYKDVKSAMVTFELDGGTFIEYLGPTGNGTLSKYVKVGSKFGDIAPVEGKNFDKLDPKSGAFSGWFYSDGSKANTGDEIKGDVTVKGNYNDIKNETLVLDARLTNRSSWDVTYSDLTFRDNGGNLELISNEGIKLNPSSGWVGTPIDYYSNMESISELKGRIRNPNAALTVHLNIAYKHVDINSFLNSHADKTLMYNGTSSVSIRGRFDSSGTKFQISDAGKTQLKNLLGVSGEINIVMNLKPEKEIPSDGAGKKAGNFAARLNVKDVGKEGRHENERFQICMIEEKEYPGTYRMQIIGENEDHITLRDEGLHSTNGMSHKLTRRIDFAQGGIVEPGIQEIHEFTFFVEGWELKFADNLNHSCTDLPIHKVNVNYVYQGQQVGGWVDYIAQPKMPTASGSATGFNGKAFLQVYGSSQGAGQNDVGWIRDYNWLDINDGKTRHYASDLTKPVTCTDGVESKMDLPPNFTVQ